MNLVKDVRYNFNLMNETLFQFQVDDPIEKDDNIEYSITQIAFCSTTSKNDIPFFNEFFKACFPLHAKCLNLTYTKNSDLDTNESQFTIDRTGFHFESDQTHAESSHIRNRAYTNWNYFFSKFPPRFHDVLQDTKNALKASVNTWIEEYEQKNGQPTAEIVYNKASEIFKDQIKKNLKEKFKSILQDWLATRNSGRGFLFQQFAAKTAEKLKQNEIDVVSETDAKLLTTSALSIFDAYNVVRNEQIKFTNTTEVETSFDLSSIDYSDLDITQRSVIDLFLNGLYSKVGMSSSMLALNLKGGSFDTDDSHMVALYPREFMQPLDSTDKTASVARMILSFSDPVSAKQVLSFSDKEMYNNFVEWLCRPRDYVFIKGSVDPNKTHTLRNSAFSEVAASTIGSRLNINVIGYSLKKLKLDCFERDDSGEIMKDNGIPIKVTKEVVVAQCEPFVNSLHGLRSLADYGSKFDILFDSDKLAFQSKDPNKEIEEVLEVFKKIDTSKNSTWIRRIAECLFLDMFVGNTDRNSTNLARTLHKDTNLLSESSNRLFDFGASAMSRMQYDDELRRGVRKVRDFENNLPHAEVISSSQREEYKKILKNLYKDTLQASRSAFLNLSLNDVIDVFAPQLTDVAERLSTFLNDESPEFSPEFLNPKQFKSFGISELEIEVINEVLKERAKECLVRLKEKIQEFTEASKKRASKAQDNSSKNVKPLYDIVDRLEKLWKSQLTNNSKELINDPAYKPKKPDGIGR